MPVMRSSIHPLVVSIFWLVVSIFWLPEEGGPAACPKFDPILKPAVGSPRQEEDAISELAVGAPRQRAGSLAVAVSRRVRSKTVDPERRKRRKRPMWKAEILAR